MNEKPTWTDRAPDHYWNSSGNQAPEPGILGGLVDLLLIALLVVAIIAIINSVGADVVTVVSNAWEQLGVWALTL